MSTNRFVPTPSSEGWAVHDTQTGAIAPVHNVEVAAEVAGYLNDGTASVEDLGWIEHGKWWVP